ncbi:hypothetical protein [Microvirga aerophila]|uniref:Uncharacterized protein n=1 Tax=Microvirga aerophila TaxID=670291 RepID=A0A512BYR5_9HYPH|nr:hypothetical protein [Microvirga aerophila]GEO17104.1 hypothetical protein MAE02_48000 [Microvirga aerophila]
MLAHPAKMDASRKGKAPELEDISTRRTGTTWSTKDLWCIAQKFADENWRNNKAEFFHRKLRFEELGYPCKLKMTFELNTGRYRSANYTSYAGLNRLPINL